MKRVCIVGGGISGLSAAYALQKRRSFGIECVIFESSPRFGGVIYTENTNGCIIEAGPDSFLTEKRCAAELCLELGLGDELIGSNDAERKTYILLDGRLVSLPDGLMFMVPTRLLSTFASPLFPWRTKLRMLGEWFARPRRASADCTVAEFVDRHYGPAMVERVTDPLLAGVFGGSAEELSAFSVLPRFVEMERTRGSLGRAMVASRQRSDRPSQPLFTSLKNGMQQMVDALVGKIHAAARGTAARVTSVKPKAGKWLVTVSGAAAEEFDAAIIATPSYATAELLVATEPALAADLRAIGYSSSVTVSFVFDEKVRAKLPAGFGFLVPRKENRQLIAVTFVHNKFPHRAPPDRALIRCFLGGTRDQEIVFLSDDKILEITLNELRDVLGITATPVISRVFKWNAAMAQYDVGHSERVQRITSVTAKTPGLALAGNAYVGIGVPDCVRSGTEAAHKVMADLGFADLEN